MQHTTNYNLNQWEATDRVTRADFNADNAKVDAAIAAVAAAAAGSAHIACGTYTGDGRYGPNNKCTITPGFKPRLLLVQTTPICCLDITEGNPDRFTLLALCGVTRVYLPIYYDYIWLQWNDTSVSWYNEAYAKCQFNAYEEQYAYVVVG